MVHPYHFEYHCRLLTAGDDGSVRLFDSALEAQPSHRRSEASTEGNGIGPPAPPPTNAERGGEIRARAASPKGDGFCNPSRGSKGEAASSRPSAAQQYADKKRVAMERAAQVRSRGCSIYIYICYPLCVVCIAYMHVYVCSMCIYVYVYVYMYVCSIYMHRISSLLYILHIDNIT